jgi:hypothetical protein
MLSCHFLSLPTGCFSKRFPNQISERNILLPLASLLQTSGFHYPKAVLSDLRNAPRYVTFRTARFVCLSSRYFLKHVFCNYVYRTSPSPLKSYISHPQKNKRKNCCSVGYLIFNAWNVGGMMGFSNRIIRISNMYYSIIFTISLIPICYFTGRVHFGTFVNYSMQVITYIMTVSLVQASYAVHLSRKQ